MMGVVADAVLRGASTDGLVSALLRLRGPGLAHHKPRPADGRVHYSGHTIQLPLLSAPRAASDLAAGVEASMTVAGSPERLAGSALRRMHYRAARRAVSAHQPNKVVVMGSSTASTSTESANTALTSVTVTDDSLDADPPPAPPAPASAPPHTAPPAPLPRHAAALADPPYCAPQSATDVPPSPRPGPAKFIFDVPLPQPAPAELPAPVPARRGSEASRSRRRSVHVTPNPLQEASAGGRTTIVVQQPSLSLDYGGCATMLLREGDGGEEAPHHLLDVTFTSEDLYEFDKRYGSPHHSRSQSVKAPGRRGAAGLLGPPGARARVASMPNTGEEEEYYRLRHFSITGKGVVNRGDSLRSRRSRSNTSCSSSPSSAPCSRASSRESSAGRAAYRVLVLGAPAVGKSSLVGQFMTSEYLHAYDTSIDDESGERSVCVLLGGEESEITFLDNPPDDVVEESAAHGYCVVYSSADRGSFAAAERGLQALWAAGHTARRAVILVANKADLARSRLVAPEEGKALATGYECKFIETSVGINHNVDELLVGLLAQIRLKQRAPERRRRGRSCRARTEGGAREAGAGRGGGARGVRGLLGRVWARESRARSCENLHAL